MVFSACIAVLVWRNLSVLKGDRQKERRPFLIAIGISTVLGYTYLAGISLSGYHRFLGWIFGGIGDWLLALQHYPFPD